MDVYSAPLEESEAPTGIVRTARYEKRKRKLPKGNPYPSKSIHKARWKSLTNGKKPNHLHQLQLIPKRLITTTANSIIQLYSAVNVVTGLQVQKRTLVASLQGSVFIGGKFRRRKLKTWGGMVPTECLILSSPLCAVFSQRINTMRKLRQMLRNERKCKIYLMIEGYKTRTTQQLSQTTLETHSILVSEF
jgi:hypothetical protein